ncbi:flagellar basal body-associated protein FliL [Clostridiales Family XIII bacterium PM5-7]
MLRTEKKERRKFVLILCGIVFSFAALVPITLYLVNKSREKAEIL